MTETETIFQPDPLHFPEGRLIDVRELAQILHVPVSWLYERTRLDGIPCVRLGKYLRFDPQEVLAFFRANKYRGPGTVIKGKDDELLFLQELRIFLVGKSALGIWMTR